RRIVDMSSIAVVGMLAGISYGASKGVIEAKSRSIAFELARGGITVNCAVPRITNTGMFRRTPKEISESNARAESHALSGRRTQYQPLGATPPVEVEIPLIINKQPYVC
ncbi:SDR family oxidoreductase, partial [Peribacillus butanolivorans]|uniref:SDR family oxidoreductase n=1 Tax=Peribacillus butanolivorans TaxID=421767 RepID=UPI00365CFA9C